MLATALAPPPGTRSSPSWRRISTGASRLMRLGVPRMKRSATRSPSTRIGCSANPSISSSSRAASGARRSRWHGRRRYHRRWRRSPRRLAARICRDGPLPFAAVMEEALYGARRLLCARPATIGPDGDYVTGSSLSPLFGRATARVVDRVAPGLGQPRRLRRDRLRRRRAPRRPSPRASAPQRRGGCLPGTAWRAPGARRRDARSASSPSSGGRGVEGLRLLLRALRRAPGPPADRARRRRRSGSSWST